MITSYIAALALTIAGAFLVILLVVFLIVLWVHVQERISAPSRKVHTHMHTHNCRLSHGDVYGPRHMHTHTTTCTLPTC